MPDKTDSGIDIVIPNWNGRHLLGTCLESLHTQSRQDFHIIIVDNGSTDDSVAFIRREYPEVTLVCLSRNCGFSAAVNAGIKAGNRPWVLLLNNDVEVERNCLEMLAEQCESQSLYDMYALKMLSFSQRHLLDGAGDGVLRGGVGYRFGTMEVDSAAYRLRKQVFGACAGAACYRRSLFENIGYFDEDFFAYLEDVDFNLRAAGAGYRCCFLPDAEVYHIGSATSGSKVNKLVVKLSTRNNLFVIFKHYSAGMFLRFLPALMVYQLFWLFFVIKKRQFPAYLAGLFDAAMLMPKIWPKRRLVAEHKSVPERMFETMIVNSEKEVIESIMARREQNGKKNGLLQLYLRIFC